MFDPSVNPYTGQPVFSAFSPMLPAEPVIPDGETVYNDIMRGINPELTTDMLPTLAKKYAQETPEQHEKRQERYKQDLVEYKKQSAAYMAELRNQVADFERTTRQMTELADTHEEQGQLNSITNAISLT